MAEANVVCLESKDRISSLSFLQRSIISSFWSQISLPPRDHQKRFLWEAPKFIEPGHPFSERRFQTVSRSIQNSRVQSKGPVVPLTRTHSHTVRGFPGPRLRKRTSRVIAARFGHLEKRVRYVFSSSIGPKGFRFRVKWPSFTTAGQQRSGASNVRGTSNIVSSCDTGTLDSSWIHVQARQFASLHGLSAA
jgi:hypothetical protein